MLVYFVKYIFEASMKRINVLKTINISVIFILLLSLEYAFSAMPATINYQGRLRQSGLPVTGTQIMRFKIWNDDGTTGHIGTKVWDSDDVTNINVANGIFSYQLGTTDGFNGLDWSQGPYWLEVTIGSGESATTLTPREPIAASAYALYAKKASSFDGLLPLANGGTNTDLTTGVITVGSIIYRTATGLAASSVTGLVKANTSGAPVAAVLSDLTNLGVAPINNPTFTGTVAGITATMVGLSNVTNESKTNMFTSPTFTGSVTMPGTGIWNSSGNVGIKTATPTGMFQVGGGSLTVLQNGNIGVGTISPQSPLDINGVIGFNPGAAYKPNWRDSLHKGIQLYAADTTGDEIEWLTSVYQNGYGFKLAYVNPGFGTGLGLYTRQNSATWTNMVTLTDSGNVGIGTTSPQATLDVSVNNSGGLGGELVLRNSAGSALGETEYLTFMSGTTPRARIISRLIDGNGGDFEFLTGFTTAGLTEKMRISGNGNVGIGTTNPGHTLDVAGVGNFTSSVNSSWIGAVTAVGGGGTQGLIGGQINNTYWVGVGGKSSASNGMGVYGAVTNSGGYGGYFENLGGGFALFVTGAAYKPGGGSWSSSSDIRLKKNIMPLTGALNKLLELKGVTFEWKEPETQGSLYGEQIGMIAQDVEKVFPKWVGTDNKGYKTLTFRGFEALTVEALRDLKSENDWLKIENDNIMKKNQELESRIKALEEKK
jgi:hypothetical protein